MSSFTDKLNVTEVGNGIWMVERPFRYYVGSENSSDFIDVLEGTITDFASVPRIFWIIFPPFGEYTQAAVLHDYLYQTHLRPKKESDKIFLEAMGVLNVPSWKKYIMYEAVNLFGGHAWKTYGMINEKLK
jgi:hypothetical protein